MANFRRAYLSQPQAPAGLLLRTRPALVIP